jgi:hypothetical protein
VSKNNYENNTNVDWDLDKNKTDKMNLKWNHFFQNEFNLLVYIFGKEFFFNEMFLRNLVS